MKIKCDIFDGCKECLDLQTRWYSKLKKKGFEDIEDEDLILLKKWTGIQLDENKVSHDKLIDVLGSNWPEQNFKKESELLNHQDFEAICKNLLKHGNNAINPKVMIKVWASHCEGLTLREIGKQQHIHYVTVFRAVKKLGELTKIMGLDSNETVIIRQFDKETDTPLIYASWRNATWFDSHTDDEIDPKFFRLKTKEIKTALSDLTAIVRIACLQNNHDQIIGYAVLNGSTIQFVYVKLDYRKQGIAKMLTKGFTEVSRPSTKIGASITENHSLKVQGEKEDGSKQISTIRTS